VSNLGELVYKELPEHLRFKEGDICKIHGDIVCKVDAVLDIKQWPKGEMAYCWSYAQSVPQVLFVAENRRSFRLSADEILSGKVVRYDGEFNLEPEPDTSYPKPDAESVREVFAVCAEFYGDPVILEVWDTKEQAEIRKDILEKSPWFKETNYDEITVETQDLLGKICK
jgi:hypothetical protein